MGDKFGLSLIHCYLGLLALAQDRPGAARDSFVAGLTIAYQGDMKLYTVYNLIGMAGFFRAQAKPAKSAALLAAAAGIAESIGLKIEPELQEPYDQALAAIRKELSQGDFQSAWGAGKNMDLERTVQYASED
jgi:hypothetical protein